MDRPELTDPWLIAAKANADALHAEAAAGRLDPALARAVIIADTLGASMDPNCPEQSSTDLASMACELAQAYRADRLYAALLARHPFPNDATGLDE